jgi:hypothetical protein
MPYERYNRREYRIVAPETARFGLAKQIVQFAEAGKRDEALPPWGMDASGFAYARLSVPRRTLVRRIVAMLSR